ncbi:MAG: leucine-rich repeat protein [Bacteroidaceae bacterium]|nr:leucine-rich repeat protein [Bacteroidaceae bacterium]
MKTKRLFFLFLLTSLSTLAGAYDVEIEGIYYNLVEEAKTAEVTYKASSEASYSGNIVIPSSVMFYGVEYSVTSIGHSAFSGCTRLTSITLPCSVTHIGKWAFAFCSSLTDMYCLAEDVPTIDGNDIGLDIKYVTLHVPEASIDAYKSTAPWSGFDSIVILTPQTGIAINKENFPDKAFRQYLLDQDYGKDGILTQEEIAELKTIEICNIHINWTETSHSEDIPSYDIHDLKGIELLTALETLDLEYVPLTVLNLQGCKSLKQVRISECEDLSLAHILIISGLENLTSLRFDLMTQVKGLRITDCPNLKEVHIGGSTFEALTVSGCPQIEQLYCSDNRISSLNLSAMTALESLSCRNNQLTKIDISAFPNLCTLSCEDNQLVSLDVSNHAELYNLCCSGNQLTSLRAANCPILTNIQCQDNYLTGQAVEHLVEDLRQTRQTDYASLFVFNTEKSDGNFFTVEQVSRAKAKGWHVYYYGIQSIHPGQYQWYSYNGESIQYKPFLEDGKIWEVYKPAELCGYEKFWIDGDTIIEGRQYYKMFSYNLEDYRTGDVWQPYAGELINRNVRVAYLCEEDSRVYIMKESANGKYQRYLLYDFSLGVGDKIKFWNTDYTVSDVTSVNVRGVERRKTHFDIGNNYHVDWLEGIGGFYHLLNPIPFYLPREDSLYYCGVGDKVYYQMDRLPSINDFAVNGKRWTYTSGASAYEYYLDGDTTIIENNRMYHGLKLYRKELDLETLPHYVGMIIPDSHYPDFKFNFNFKVAGGSVRSLYDFRLKEGDSGVFNGRSLTVQSITKEIFEGYEHRVFLLTDEEGNCHKWIEDIGSVTDLLQDVSLDSAEGELQSCVDHGVEIYNRDHIVPVDYTYRPFVEEGKTWVLGWYKEGADSTDPERIEYQYLQGDTIIDGLQYKRWMIDDGENMPARYAGAVREDERVVFFCPQGTTAPLRLYDFASPAGPGGWYNEVFMDIDIIYDINLGEKFAIDTDTYKGCGREVRFNVQEKATWLQGVGNMGLYNLIMSDGFCRLLSCTVGDEVLYYDASLIPQNLEVKKKKLDFTHVIKAQPKAPRHRAQQEGIETLKGEYSDSEMFVRLNNLAGTYAVTLADATGHPVYTKEVLTDNVLALSTDLVTYAPGTYTLTVENEYEKFVTTLNLTTDIASTPAPFQDKDALYDLSGRKLEHAPQKGIYIQNGKKVLVK